MFGSEILEVAVGVIFIFLVVGLVCSAIREGIEAWVKSRSAYLEHGIRELLYDREGTGLARDMYEHPLIYGLYGGEYKPGKVAARPAMFANGGELPSYIPSRNFALALMDIAARGPITDAVSGDPDAPAISLASMRQNVRNLGNPAVQRILLTLIDSAQGDIDKAQRAIEGWYESSMDRISGWYKRSTHRLIFWIGLGVALALNINIITIADYLYRNDAARTTLVARAQTAATDTAYLQRSYSETMATLDSVGLPIGWTQGWGAPRRSSEGASFGVWNFVLAPLLGILFTALAATVGAPFWFDALNKMMVVRSTVKPHEKSREEASEDRQAPAQPAPEVVVERETSADGGGDSTRGGVVRTSSVGLGTPRDRDSGEDGCDAEMADAEVAVTSDEDLPAAQGGVVGHA
jgi:hypothetical protein